MKTTRGFESECDRYVFDCGLCKAADGWAQIDSEQDAWYFGQWTQPATLRIFTYCEGDTILLEAESPEEYTAEIRRLAAWHEENGFSFQIDEMCNETIIGHLSALGLSEYMATPPPDLPEPAPGAMA